MEYLENFTRWMVFACINYAYDTEIIAKYIEDNQCFDV